MEGETTRGRNDSGRNDSGRTGKWAKRPVTGTISVIFFYFFFFFPSVHTAEACTGPAMLCIWPVFHIQVWCILMRVSVLDTAKWTDFFAYQCSCNLLYCLYISFNVHTIYRILTKLGFSLWVYPTFGLTVQQNRKSPSTVLTAHNSTGNRTFMCHQKGTKSKRNLFWHFVHLICMAHNIQFSCL